LAFDDVYFTANDGVRLNGWFVPRPRSFDVIVVSRQRGQHQPPGEISGYFTTK
jgi:hypothetical protein